MKFLEVIRMSGSYVSIRDDVLRKSESIYQTICERRCCFVRFFSERLSQFCHH
ncbi:hypothetical protein [Methanoplanus limicola]|uniref:hypothetical protein n=1 Tax=Methanoplanus limicola TaxID=2315 RepID=UPI0012F63746|nr:hypothetical protein [Methanoplanus limicola]